MTAPVSVMIGWAEQRADPDTGRPCGIHPLASVGGPPEHRGWKVGDEYLPPDIHPTALVHAYCTVDGGMTYAATTTIGPRSFLMARTHIGHNCQIGADVEFGAGVVVCGEVTVGDGAKIAGNTWIKPKVRVGAGAIVGGGSVVTKDVPPHEVWAGNPARYMKNADTHPASRGFEARRADAASVYMTTDEWERSRQHAQHTRWDPDQLWELMKPFHYRAGDTAGR